MKINDWINRTFRRGTNVISDHYGVGYGGVCLSRYEFGKTVFVSITELLTSLINDVAFKFVSGLQSDFASFAAFVELNGEYVLTRLMLEGYVVVGKCAAGLRVLDANDYSTIGSGNTLRAVPRRGDIYTECYVLRSSIFEMVGQSDFGFCSAFVKYLNNALNASNTTLERLGSLIVLSPKSPSNLPTVVTLDKSKKEELENEIVAQYGSLDKQRQVMVLPREVNINTINLAALDLKTTDRVRTAILAICDRLKVPANQVAIIDANSSKSLSNGSELREGDFNKYQSFERLLNRTFIRMAGDMGLVVDYTIYNKPKRDGSDKNM